MPRMLILFVMIVGSVTAQSEGARVSRDAPIAAPRFERVSTAVVSSGREPFFNVGDFDADGDPDLLVEGRRLWRNDSTADALAFTEVTAEVGLAARGPAGVFCDFDRDGRLDVVTSSGEVWVQSADGRFLDASARLGIRLETGHTSSLCVVDLDGDGWLDVLSGGNNTYGPTTHYPRTVWLNRPRPAPLARWISEGRPEAIQPMIEVSDMLGADRRMYGRSLVACDFDSDGDQDVYSGNYHLKANDLFVNENGRLEQQNAARGVSGRFDPDMFTRPDTGERIGYTYGHTIGCAWGDLDNDGWFDVWVANLVHKYAGPATPRIKQYLKSDFDHRGFICDDSNLFRNSGPPAFTFSDARVAMGIPPRPLGDRSVFRGDELWSNVMLGDLDNDGWLDAFCNQIYGHLSYSHGVLYRNVRGQFEEVHAQAGVKIWGGYGSTLADFDSDGRLDLVVSGADTFEGDYAVHVFRNVSPRRPWIGFDLAVEPDAPLVGAEVLLVHEDGVQIRQVASTMGSHSQSRDARLHFGLGNGDPLQRVIVTWPDGRVRVIEKPKPGRYHNLTAPLPAFHRTDVALMRTTAGPAVAIVSAGQEGQRSVVGPARILWVEGADRRPTSRSPARSMSLSDRRRLVALALDETGSGWKLKAP